MQLPKRFLDRMKSLLGDEFEDFIHSYDRSKHQGLRVNTLKISVEEFLRISPFKLKPIPWTKDGFYYEEGERPAKHPYYHSGLYYIQEPSAMAPASVLDVLPGDKVLDLCAAPGGKTIQLAAKLSEEGIIVTNDINLQRVKALIKNIELFGIKNAIVTNETPEKLKKYFSSYFDKILIDAPCSGEGMFRKDEKMIKSWERQGIEPYVAMQRAIMDCVDGMLKEDGELLYSTCTFSPEENEGIIEEFTAKHRDYMILPIPKALGFDEGRPQWIAGKEALKDNARLWPHKIDGEGHFLAWLKKECDVPMEIHVGHPAEMKAPKVFSNFMEENLNIQIEGSFEIHNEQLYLLPEGLPPLKGLKILRSGWLLGTIKKDRFEPSQAMAMALSYRDSKRVVNFHGKDPMIIKYLKGETLDIEGAKGWTLVCVDHFPVGWAKQTGTMLKNYYPPAWRWID
ncbi:NOL1/NOP2/sun family putative RNA methylase [Anaerosolibacter carboniphilus]|uniref:NOL1/NOP2/sun family putative RNA methylase n=1 Tax=Anaerosolibacter carboniphilus TaxID=1417629 RepID=A0A841KN03_9FIRM|nr:RsmB/NOP family class I SAM-dependent RNA methyltransferase [Anaerosolibacter carboniphilus]MBB6214651.1 NOL1/NOP2/sun family putative RNA methylase [Anaerosolibacter carboniphilus]